VDVTRANWRKSSYSSGNGGDCVESASSAAGVLVRDSKDPNGPALALTPQDWRAFTGQIKAGAFDLS
jgi:hypothetical protein